MSTTKTTTKKSNPAADAAQQATAWMTDPTLAARAWQDAMLSGIDGLISMHEEFGKAITKQLDSLRTERERFTKAGDDALTEVFDSGIEASRKALGYARDQVERFARPQPEA